MQKSFIRKFAQALTDTIPIKVPFSYFNIPIHYSLAELEAFLNGKIKKKFLETTISPTKNKKDSLKIEMRKAGRIQLSSRGDKLVVIFPLHVTGTITHSRVNFLTKGIKPVETEVDLELHTPVDLDRNWNLMTRFSLVKTTWKKQAVVTLAGVNFNLTKKLDEVIKKNKEKLTAMMDQEINKAVSLSKPVGKIWTDLQKAMIIHKKPPKAYLRFITHGISGNLNLTKTDVVCYTTIKTQVVMVSETKMRADVVPLPAFKKQNSEKTFSDAYIYAFAEFDQMNDEMQNKLNGLKFEKKGLSVTVKESLLYGSDSGLTVEINTKGTIDSKLIATVQPVFDSVEQDFVMKNFQFHVVSSNVLLNMGNSFFHDMIRDTVQFFLTVAMDSLITKIPAAIDKAISKGKTGKAIDVDVTEFTIHSCDVEIDATRIHFVVHASFESDIELKHLNSGKTIKIKPKAKGKVKAKAKPVKQG